MMVLQLSSGQGPSECERAVFLALRQLVSEADRKSVSMAVLDQVHGDERNCLKSVLIELKSENSSNVQAFIRSWTGSLMWACASPFRPKHKRKNWFFSGQVYEVPEYIQNDNIEYQTCRSSGAGGQHVNTTDSAVRATHMETGLSVRVDSERSQHANKRIATVLILQKLEQAHQLNLDKQGKARRQQHIEIERGNPVRTFKGEKFIDVTS